MKLKKKKTFELIDGEIILYHILQKQIIQAYDVDNPPTEVKFMIEQLLLWGGVWFMPQTYQQFPVLLPYVVRDAACRKKDPVTGEDTRGVANNRGFMPDDNSSIKGIPKSLTIKSVFSEMNGGKLGKGYVASHCWRVLQHKSNLLASKWERTNSFIPNLVWLPAQLSKLTDREGSYAQRFIQYISCLLYRNIELKDTMLSEIWDELKAPSIIPVSEVNLDKLNYFENSQKWCCRRKDNLLKELQSILNILDGGLPVVEIINVSKYAPTLANVAKSMEPSDLAYLKKWIGANLQEIKCMSEDGEREKIEVPKSPEFFNPSDVLDRNTNIVIIDYSSPYESFGWKGAIHIEIDLDNKTITSAGWKNGSIPLSKEEAQRYLDFFSDTRHLNDFFNERKAYDTPGDTRFEHFREYSLQIQWNGRRKKVSVGYPDIPFKHPF